MTDQNKNYFLSLSDNFEYKKIRKFYINYKTDINNKIYDILVKNNNFTNIKTRIMGIKNDLMYRCTMFMVAYNSGIRYNNINSNIKRKSCYNIIIYDINNIIIYVSNSISIYSYESYEKLIIELYNKTNIFLLSFMNSADKICISLNCKYTDGIYSLNEEKRIEKNYKIENINLISVRKKTYKIFKKISKLCPKLFIEKYSIYKNNHKYIDNEHYSQLLITCVIYNIEYLVNRKYIIINKDLKDLINNIFKKDENYNKYKNNQINFNDSVDFKQDLIKMNIMLKNIKIMKKIIS